MRMLAHLSDLHFGRIDDSVLAPLRAAVHSAAPDLIAISGDFTQRAKRTQFAAAREFLDSLEPPKLVVPGNHDVPLWNLARRFLTPFARYREFISTDLEPEYQDDEMIVIGVNTARSFAHGEGRINARQVNRIVRRLAAAPAPLIRVIVTHHPFDLPPGVEERRLLGRARMAMIELARADADLFLSGHLHLSHASHSAERYRHRRALRVDRSGRNGVEARPRRTALVQPAEDSAAGDRAGEVRVGPGCQGVCVSRSRTLPSYQRRLDHRSLAIARVSDRRRFLRSSHKSPTCSTRSAIVRIVNDWGSTVPASTSSHVHGAETGAPDFGRTA